MATAEFHSLTILAAANKKIEALERRLASNREQAICTLAGRSRVKLGGFLWWTTYRSPSRAEAEHFYEKGRWPAGVQCDDWMSLYAFRKRWVEAGDRDRIDAIERIRTLARSADKALVRLSHDEARLLGIQ